VKVKELSLLIVDEDKSMRQQLAALVSDRYKSVTAAAPEQVTSLMVSKSFDLVLAPIIEGHVPEEVGDSRRAEGITASALRSRVTGKTYEFRSVNQEASGCATNPFERVLLEMAIERAEIFVNQVKGIVERDAMY
jgi:hypothetical protein